MFLVKEAWEKVFCWKLRGNASNMLNCRSTFGKNVIPTNKSILKNSKGLEFFKFPFSVRLSGLIDFKSETRFHHLPLKWFMQHFILSTERNSVVCSLEMPKAITFHWINWKGVWVAYEKRVILSYIWSTNVTFPSRLVTLFHLESLLSLNSSIAI